MSLEKLIERKIRDAQTAGVFDNLAGVGKPLVFSDDERQDGWAGLHMLRQNGFLPEWLELRKQIHHDKPAVVAALDEWRQAIERAGSREHALARRAGDRYRAAAKAINAKIDLHNLRCPSLHFEITRFRDDAQPPAPSGG